MSKNVTSRHKITAFEPKELCAGPNLNRSEKCSLAPLAARFSQGSNPVRLPHSSRLAALVGFRSVRGTGFEPADLYRTAPSTLRRWPSLATHARGVSLQSSVIRGAIKGLSFVDRPVGGPRFRASVPAVSPRKSSERADRGRNNEPEFRISVRNSKARPGGRPMSRNEGVGYLVLLALPLS